MSQVSKHQKSDVTKAFERMVTSLFSVPGGRANASSQGDFDLTPPRQVVQSDSVYSIFLAWLQQNPIQPNAMQVHLFEAGDDFISLAKDAPRLAQYVLDKNPGCACQFKLIEDQKTLAIIIMGRALSKVAASTKAQSRLLGMLTRASTQIRDKRGERAATRDASKSKG